MNSTFKRLLADLLGDRLSVTPEDIALHSKGKSFYNSVHPMAVCYPGNEEEIQKIILYCNEYRVNLVAFGAGTSIEGQAIPCENAISLDMSQMNKILALHADDQDCIAEAGVRKKKLNKALEKYDLFFPAGPLVDASLGGMASTSASGINAVRYGTMKENVLSLRFVNPTGEIINTGSRARKSAAGYDLTHLLIGAEGTLGIITQLTLKLQPIPESILNATANFDNLVDAVRAVTEVLKTHIKPAAIELLDEVQIRAVNNFSGSKLEEKPTLFLELHGSGDALEKEIAWIKSIFEKTGSKYFDSAIDQNDREQLWKAREDCYYANIHSHPDKSGFVTDVCVPLSNLVRCIEETKNDLDYYHLEAPILGHVGDGNFHLVLTFDPEDSDSLNKIRTVHDRLIQRAIELGGTCTGEHGIGLGKIDYLVQEKGKETVAAMKAIKQAWDPNNIMNPGKIFRH